MYSTSERSRIVTGGCSFSSSALSAKKLLRRIGPATRTNRVPSDLPEITSIPRVTCCITFYSVCTPHGYQYYRSVNTSSRTCPRPYHWVKDCCLRRIFALLAPLSETFPLLQTLPYLPVSDVSHRICHAYRLAHRFVCRALRYSKTARVSNWPVHPRRRPQ